jgi:hypothetical protein
MVKMENLKTPEGQFLLEMRNDFGFTPVVAQAVLKRSKEMLGGLSFQKDQPRVGQMKVLAVSADEPAGKPLSECELVQIIITVDGGNDDLETLRENGAVGLRRIVLLRITSEAVEQGAYLSEEDAAGILRCDVRTVKRDVRHFRDQGIYIPLRGHMINTGRGQTHKVLIVRWYVQGMTFTEIKIRTHHSINAICRYIDMFGRVVILIHRGLTILAIAQVISISESLTEEYVKLYHELDKPEYQDQINRIVDRVRTPGELKVEKKRRMM